MRFAGLFVAVALIVGAGGFTPSQAEEPENLYGTHDGYVLSIQATGDMAGAIEPCGCKLPVGGLGRRAGYSRELAKQLKGQAAVMMVDAGHLFDPAKKQSEAYFDAAVKNEWTLRALGVADYAALNVAVADLKALDPWRAKDGYDNRLKEFPALDRFISANVEPASDTVVGFKPYVIREVAPSSTSGPADRIRVGIIGLTGLPDSVEAGSHWKVTDPIAAAKKVAAELRSSCDFLVVLAYLDQNTANKIEEAIPGVDLIVVANRKTAPKGDLDLTKPATVTVADEAKSVTEVRVYPSMSAAASKRWIMRRRTVLLGPNVPDDSDTRLTVQRAKGASRKQPVAQ